jgi:hypothetical protein
MNLHGYFGLSEGTQDSEFRTLADDIHKIVLGFLRDTSSLYQYAQKGLDAPQGEPDEGTRAVTISFYEQVSDKSEPLLASFFDTVSFSFIVREQSGPPSGNPTTVFDFSNTGPFREGNLAWITIETEMESSPLEPFPDEWQWYVMAVKEGDAHDLWNKHRNHIIHEITHALDWMRWKGSEVPRQRYDSNKILYGTPEEKAAERKKYLSDPMEMNAVIQQKLYEIERTINRSSRESAIRSMGKSPQGLYQLVRGRFNQEDYAKYASEDFDRRLMKRVAQLWYDVLSHYEKPKNQK